MRSGFVLASALLLSGCIIDDFGPSDRYQADFHYTYDLQPGGRISAEGFNGSIEITGWDQNKVEINGTRFASTEEMRDAIRIDIHNTPESIDVRAVRPSTRVGSMGVRYTMHVPNKAELDRITTSNGSIRIHDVASAAHLQSSNGGIRVDHVGGDVDARTSNSSIELDSVRGGAVVKTSNGRIHAENVSGNCEAETSNSSITVRLESAPDAPLRLTSSNGSIDLTMTKPPKNSIRAHTSNSGITLHLPSGTSARVMASTSNSSISSDFEVATQVNGEGRKNHLEGAIGTGGPTLDLSTSNGHIRILRGNAD
jgi:DUF4097 and DUF4098 domain-containing protein YvlB